MGVIVSTLGVQSPYANDRLSISSASGLNSSNSGYRGFRSKNSVSQSIGNAPSPQTVLLVGTTPDWDTDNFYVSPGKLFIPAGLGGIYQFTVYVNWAANNAGFRQLGFGVSSDYGMTEMGVDGGSTNLDMTGLVNMAAGAQFLPRVWQNSGGSLAIPYNIITLTYLGPVPS